MIKNIIFDLGGVILNINYKLTSLAFQKLGVLNFDELYSQAQQSNLFDLLETGTISEPDFRNQIRNLTHLNLSDSEIDTAWNAMLLDLPIERIHLLQNIRANYKTFLLSNTNSIHLRAYTQNLFDQHKIESLSALFDKEFFSHEVHLRKPNIEIFEYVIHNQDLNVSETLFIDDSIQHVNGAKKAGLHAFHLDVQKGMNILDLFESNFLKNPIFG